MYPILLWVTPFPSVPAVIARILRHVGFPTELPAMRPARPPPVLDEATAP